MIDQSFMMSIIASALKGSQAKLDKPIDEYIAFARSQQLETLFIAGLKNSGYTLPKDLRNFYIRSIMTNERQQEVAKKLYAIFSEHQIDYMPLKGCVLKPAYPAPEMRSMGDIDILVRFEQYSTIRKLMLKNGFTEGSHWEHEYKWEKDGVHIELHKWLISSCNKDFFTYFGDGWQFAIPASEPYCYKMSPEDTFIYLFTHFAKHYRAAGAGIRQALDLYIYREKHPEIDESYIVDKMQLLKLDRFYVNTMHMLDVWFSDAECAETTNHTEASKIISDRLFNSGVFGTEADSRKSEIIRQSKAHGSIGKARLFMWAKRLFPSYKDMCKQYSLLEKAPLFLPFTWLARWMSILSHRKNLIRDVVKRDTALSGESVKAYHEMLRKSGIDFNF